MIVAFLSLSVTFGISGFAQEGQDAGKDKEKDKKTVTVKIVRDEDGKVTVIDTTISTDGKVRGYQYEYTIQDMDEQMARLDEQMRDLERDMEHFEIQMDLESDLDTVYEVGDSTVKRVIIRKGGAAGERPCPRGEFRFGFEEFPGFEWHGGDFMMPRMPMSPQWEALLQSIPMGRITSFEIKDRKDGKRIIIDMDDEAPVMIMAPYRHHGKANAPRKIIIERDVQDLQVPPPPPPPPPPAEEKKGSAPQPEKG